ncbi:kinase-like domain-containing protein [Mycena metata]|uniref:Kinase-like domain-containing protein n=1 Tax=Mycena metata TaxID=1033252 RepID=A0AAD7IRD4_9AGAR|nr:kinase-like domain-containing protein [Mycena metata]
MKPETSKSARDLARLGLSAAGAAMELVSVCVPIPGLQLAAATTQKIFGLVDQMRLNKRRAQLLASSAREAVQTLDEAMSGIPLEVLESAFGPTIQEFSQVLVSIEKRIEEFLHLTFLQRLVQYASIQDELGELDSKARDASERCKLKLNIDIKHQQVVDELARQKDTKAMLEKLQSNELARQEDVKALKEQLQALVRDPDRIADTIGLQGAHIDKASRDALQSLSLRILSRPTFVEPEVRGFVEEATKVIKSRTNYHGPRTKPWVMKRGSFERREVIGAGGFSVVYKGRWKEGDMDVAIKEFIHDEDIDDVMDEIWIWRRMEHPNLLPFIGGALIEPPYFAVSPYCAHGNVLQYISRHKDVDRLQLIIDITRGVDYLHSSHVVHGDLKARNVLISDQGTVFNGEAKRSSDFAVSEAIMWKSMADFFINLE